MREITSNEEFAKLVVDRKDDVVIVVDFFAVWCGPCKRLAPLLEAASHELKDIEIYKVDVEKLESIADKYEVINLPTVFLFKNGVRDAKPVPFLFQQNTEEKFTEYLQEVANQFAKSK